eukprot:COSAG02_NODE_10677_length_1885_cov_2.860022_3_plen_90_part_01
MSGVCQALIGILSLGMNGHLANGSDSHKDVALVVDSRIAMYKVVNAAAQRNQQSRLTGTAGLCLDLIERINELGITISWVWVKGHADVPG